MYWIPLAIDEHMLDFGFFAEQIAVGNHQVGDLAGLDAAEDIARTEYLRGVEGERTQRGIRGQSRVDRFFQVLADVFRPFETIGIKRELHSGFGEFRWGTRSAVTETQIAQGLLLFGIGIFLPGRPFQADQHRHFRRGNGGGHRVALLAAPNRCRNVPFFGQQQRAHDLHLIVRGN